MGNNESKADLIGEIVDKMTQSCTDEDIKELWKLITTYHSQNHQTSFNLISGIPCAGDRVIYHHLISCNSESFARRLQSISYPPKDTISVRKATITGIAILDVKNDETGGEASIESGGIGFEFVEIALVSKWYRNMSFCIVLFGKYLTEDNNKLIDFRNNDNYNDNSVLTLKNNLK